MTRYESKCLCTVLRKATRRVTRLYDMALAPSGLKVTQYALLAQIQRCAPVAVGELAEAQVMDAGGLAHTLKPLERDGYICHSVDPQDRRSRLISLTPLGEAKLAETRKLWDGVHRNFEKAFGPERAAALRDALRLLASDDFAASFEETHTTSL